MVKVSIIIPVKEINDYIRKFVPIILKQSFNDFEIIILPNEKTSEKFAKTRIIPSGNVGPAKKRDLGVKNSKGSIVAFIDDDAYPEKDWLKKAIENFKDNEIGAIGGPNLTPPDSNFFQKVSGEALASFVVSGPSNYRYKIDKRRPSNDLPSCNLFVRKPLFIKAGGFDTGFWPGEDTKLCFEILKYSKIIYDPKVVVYHHRRENLNGYINQVKSYAVHRGYFMKVFPKTSLKPNFFIPPAFVFFIFFGSILSFFSEVIRISFIALLFIYFLILMFEAAKTKKILHMPYFICIAFLTHVVYGIGVLVGLVRNDMTSKYR